MSSTETFRKQQVELVFSLLRAVFVWSLGVSIPDVMSLGIITYNAVWSVDPMLQEKQHKYKNK